MTWIGRRSYAIYLWHVAALWCGLRLFPSSRAVATVAGVGMTIALAALSNQLVERPALRIKRRFARRPSLAHDDPLERTMTMRRGPHEDTSLAERS